MPPTTSTTIATLMSAIHTPRLARDMSSRNRSRNSWSREIMSRREIMRAGVRRTADWAGERRTADGGR